MDATTLSRLSEFEKEKKFYDALQFYRTKVTRSFRLKNANEVAIPLVKHALEFFFRGLKTKIENQIFFIFRKTISMRHRYHHTICRVSLEK